MRLLHLSSFHKTRLVLFSLIVSALPSCGSESESTALGTIERDRIILKSTAAEIIREEPVKEGTLVEAGTLLVQLDDRRQQAKLAAAQAELMRAGAQWEQRRNGARVEDIDAAKAEVDGALAGLTVAEKDYQRALEVRSKNLVSQSNVDQALARRDSSEAKLKTARKHLLILTNGTRKEELDQAEAQYNAAQAQLELEQYQLDELSVIATRNGYLDSLPWHVGERVQSGTTIAVLLAGKQPFARVYVPEPWRAKLKVGDSFSVKVDGINEPIKGTLRWISSEPAFTPYYALNEIDRARLMYLAEFDLPPDRNIPIGSPAEVMLAAKSSGEKK